MRLKFLLSCIIAGIALFSFSTWKDCSAQTKSEKTTSDSTKRSTKKGTGHKKQGEKIFLDKVEILGKIEKPQTVFILPGKDPNIDDIQVDRSFFKEIFRPVEFDNLKTDKELVDSIKKIK